MLFHDRDASDPPFDAVQNQQRFAVIVLLCCTAVPLKRCWPDPTVLLSFTVWAVCEQHDYHALEKA
jgi:hypothetical protein